MADFADETDVETAYGASLPTSPERVTYLLSNANARLRILLPSLAAAVDDDEDLAILAKDVVAQAVIRRLPMASGGPQPESQTQSAGPWTTTVRYTEDRSETFSDDDLALLRDALSRLDVGASTTGVGTIRLGRPDWTYP